MSDRSHASNQVFQNATVTGNLAFKLYDTYGFPLDLTRVIADGRGWRVDEAGFETAMGEQRHRGEFRGSGEVAVESVYQEVARKVGATTFLGYDTTTSSSRVTALIARGASRGGGRAAIGKRRGRRPSDAVLRRAGGPSRGLRLNARWRRSHARHRREAPGVDTLRSLRRTHGRRVAGRRCRRFDCRRRTTRRRPAQPLGHAPLALGAPRNPRRPRHAKGLAGGARAAAVRFFALRP